MAKKRRHTMGNASSPESYSSDSTASSGHENANSPLRSPDTTVYEDFHRGSVGSSSPFLAIEEEPIDKFRFRYITEMQGPHGAIFGEKSVGRKKAKSWPTVKLCKYSPQKANQEVVIRCTLATTHDNVDDRITHVHRLICKKDGEEDDPVDVKVLAPQYTAEFKNMTIIYTKKPDQVVELCNKKIRHKSKYSIQSCVPTTDKDAYIEEAEQEIQDKMSKQILNQACLKFEALIDNGRGFYELLCPPIFSKPISNIKSSDFGDLKICKQSAWRGSCIGGDTVFVFVERVQKDNIKVKFFETDKNDEIGWEDYADFTPQDVHHQYGIVFRTPAYKSLTITENVSVRFQLYRPTDQAISEPHEWEYKPDVKNLHRETKRKKPKQATPFFSSFDQRATQSPFTPTTVAQQVGPNEDMDWLLQFLHDTPGLPSVSVDDLCDLDLYVNTNAAMETDKAQSVTSSNPSFTEILDRLITPGEEQTKTHIKEMLSYDRFQEWAILNGLGETAQQILSEHTVSSSGNEIDGVVRRSLAGPQATQQMAGIVATHQTSGPQATHQMAGIVATHQMAGPQATHQMAGIVATHQMAGPLATHQMARPEATHQMAEPLKTYESPRQRLARRFERVPVEKGKSDNRAKPEMGPAVVCQVSSHEVNEHDCFTSVEKILAKLHQLKMKMKLNDDHMRIALSTLFSYTIGDNEDSLFHIMVERNSYSSRNMQMFLSLVKEYQLQEVLDQKNISGVAPLHLAVRAEKKQIVVILLDSGANVNVRDNENNTPLQLAVGNNYVNIVQALMARNPDLSVVNENGYSVLHQAVINENLEMISNLLVKFEGSVYSYDLINQTDKIQGHTALHIAVTHRFIDGVKLLLSFANCNVNAMNYSRVTPLGLVLESKFNIDQEIAYLLIRHKADPSMVKLSKEEIELKEDEDEGGDDDVVTEEKEVCCEEEPYRREWNKDSELFDHTVVAKLCPILDRCNGWKQLLPQLNYSELETEHIGKYWSPSLLAFHLASSHKPEITIDVIRSAILKMPREYSEAIRIIDNYMLTKLGL